MVMVFIPQPPSDLITHFLNNSFVKRNAENILLKRKSVGLSQNHKLMYELETKNGFVYYINGRLLSVSDRLFKFDESPIVKITKTEFYRERENSNIVKGKFRIIHSPNTEISISAVNYNDTKGTIIHSKDAIVDHLIDEIVTNFQLVFRSVEHSFENDLFTVLKKAKVI